MEQQPGHGFAAAGRQTLGDHAAYPATGIVFRAQHRIGQAAFAGAVVDAADRVPRAATGGVALGGVQKQRRCADRSGPVHRPLPADFKLFSQAARQTVGGVDGAVGAGRVACTNDGAHRAAEVGAVLHRGIQRPVFDQAGRAQQEHVRKPLRERQAVGRDKLVAKQVALHRAQAQRLSARCGIEHAGGHAGGQLVRIGHAVDAGEAAVGVDGIEVEVFGGGVKVGQTALIAKRRVDVKHTRLQGLAHGLAKEDRVALKHPSAVDAEAGYHARHLLASGIRPADQRRVERVAGGVQRQLGCQCETGGLVGIGDARQGVQAHAGGAAGVGSGQVVGVGEAIEFSFQAHLQASVWQPRLTNPQTPRHAGAQLRHTLIGCLQRRIQALQQLPLLHASVGAPVAQSAYHLKVRRQQARRVVEVRS